MFCLNFSLRSPRRRLRLRSVPVLHPDRVFQGGRGQGLVPRLRLPRRALRAAAACGAGGAGRGRAGRGGVKREVVEVRGDARPLASPTACPSASFPPRPPSVLPSPPVHDGNTMAAAAQLSLTQVTPTAGPPGSTRRVFPALPHRSRALARRPLSGRPAGARVRSAGAIPNRSLPHPEPRSPRPRLRVAWRSAPPRAAPTRPPPRVPAALTVSGSFCAGLTAVR